MLYFLLQTLHIFKKIYTEVGKDIKNLFRTSTLHMALSACISGFCARTEHMDHWIGHHRHWAWDKVEPDVRHGAWGGGFQCLDLREMHPSPAQEMRVLCMQGVLEPGLEESAFLPVQAQSPLNDCGLPVSRISRATPSGA